MFSWCFQPNPKSISQTWSFPQGRGENNKYVKPPPSMCMYVLTIYMVLEPPIWKKYAHQNGFFISPRFRRNKKKVKKFFPVIPPLLVYMGVSSNGGTPQSSILIGFSIINHPFWGTPIFGNTHIAIREKGNFLQWRWQRPATPVKKLQPSRNFPPDPLPILNKAGQNPHLKQFWDPPGIWYVNQEHCPRSSGTNPLKIVWI